MFRIVTDFVERPSFLLLCDDRRCGCAATGALPAKANEAERHQAAAPFIKGALEAGWVIGIDQHLCPQHAQRIEQGRRLIEVPQFNLKN
jgi:hypothetical protein